MQLAQLRRPLQAAATASRPAVLTSFTLPLRPAIQPTSWISGNLQNGVEGRRYASVKSQGAYKVPNKKTIAKKMGCKRTGDQFVIPGNIIFKQRGTTWHAGENTIRGRNHTIHAAVEGYVKYYRDPERHPDKQYIGVAFNKEDTLPYPRDEPRRRKLNMVPTTRKIGHKQAEINASGIPNRVVQPANLFNMKELEKSFWPQDREREMKEALEAQANEAKKKDLVVADAGKNALKLSPEEVPATKNEQRKFVHKLEFITKRWAERRRTRKLHFNPSNYSYAESNSAIGRLAGRDMYVAPWKLGGRKSRFKSRRRKREQELAKKREQEQQEFLARKERKIKEEAKRKAKLAKQLAAGAGAGKNKALPLEAPAQAGQPAEGKKGKKPQ